MVNSEQPINPIQTKDNSQIIGLTKRDYFAGLAMQGFISSPNTYETDGKEIRTQTEIAIFAVDMADELLKQLNWEHGNTNKV